MTNYFGTLAAIAALAASACSAAATPAPTAKPAPVATPAPVAKPAPAAQPAPAAAGVKHYVQAPGSSLTFTFVQAGAESRGSFGRFSTELDYDENNLAASSLKVSVNIASLNTQDK